MEMFDKVGLPKECLEKILEQGVKLNLLEFLNYINMELDCVRYDLMSEYEKRRLEGVGK